MIITKVVKVIIPEWQDSRGLSLYNFMYVQKYILYIYSMNYLHY